jgi:two-component system chemotaxis response regulator CheB
MTRTRVLIVDDSALVRQMLNEFLSSDPTIEVVGTAADPYAAREKIKQLNPDVLTLDVEMPRMDGITFLRNLMRLRPMPVVMVSALTAKGAEVTLEALELGAVDFVSKPRTDVASALEDYRGEIIEKVKTAARARIRPLGGPQSEPGTAGAPPKKGRVGLTAREGRFVIAIGGSTGGTEAVLQVISTLPPDAPPTLVAQHIPAAFSGPFAKRLGQHSSLVVREAEDGARLLSGHAYVAPGDRHLTVARDGSFLVCRLLDDEPVNQHRPSVDLLFRSVARVAGADGIGVLLTGMGDDGAAGLAEMREAGAATLAQDEASSVIWGMPGAAVKMGAVEKVVPLEEMATEILAALKRD